MFLVAVGKLEYLQNSKRAKMVVDESTSYRIGSEESVKTLFQSSLRRIVQREFLLLRFLCVFHEKAPVKKPSGLRVIYKEIKHLINFQSNLNHMW